MYGRLKRAWNEGLPVGMQIVGRYRDDFSVLQLAHAFEQATQIWKRRPAIAAQKELPA